MSHSQVLATYRALARCIPRLSNPQKARDELRTTFRRPLQETESVKERLQQANDRLAFVRMVTPKQSPAKGGRWVYRNGQKYKIDDSNGPTARVGSNVHTNWDGKNLDPCSVKRHNQQLKRMGFVNNAHAKGYF